MATPRTGKKDKSLRNYLKDFPGGPVAKTPRSPHRGQDSIPGQGTRSHTQQQRVSAVQERAKIPRAATKIWCELVRTNMFNKRKGNA